MNKTVIKIVAMVLASLFVMSIVASIISSLTI